MRAPNRTSVVVTRDEVERLVVAYEAMYAAATRERYSHDEYESRRFEWEAVRHDLLGIRRKTDESYRVDEAFSDNSPLDVESVVAALTLTDHHVVLDGLWIAAGTDHYGVRDALRNAPVAPPF